MSSKLEEKDWDLLLRRIKNGKCTPFLGAGACFGALPLGGDIARKWAQDYQYPLDDRHDLARVAQFLAVQLGDSIVPKEMILEEFRNSKPPEFKPPNFKDSDEPHGVLADLPIPVYMTTNYDSFMVQALQSRYRDPKRELCRWNALVKGYSSSIFDSQPGFSPTPANPIVFHLHGHDEMPESLVLTEDDYLDFLANISSQQDLLPLCVKQALAADSLLFIGYSLADWNFRVLIRGLRTAGRLSVAVLLPPAGPKLARQKAQKYMTNYYQQIEKMDLRIYWGTAKKFSAELRQRWEIFTGP